MMKTIYEHVTDTSRIEAVERWDGGADIMMTCGIGTPYEDMMRHHLSTTESDKFGAALCKDIITNYMKHNANLNKRNADLQSTIRGLESSIHDCIVDHNKHTNQLYARIEYLEAINTGLEGDLSNIRVANTLHKERCGERVGELDDCKKAFFILLDERSELGAANRGLEAINRGLESDVSNLRMSNALYRKRWNEHEVAAINAEKHIV